jgi:hypothetical protein
MRCGRGFYGRWIAASWLAIWLGTVLIVTPDAVLANVGIGLWAIGLLLQYFLGIRWMALKWITAEA